MCSFRDIPILAILTGKIKVSKMLKIIVKTVLLATAQPTQFIQLDIVLFFFC